jgi:pyrroline-5-carboxylate reductase
MQIGLIGAGNIARALARGWDEPLLVSDAGSGRAPELARELDGEALETRTLASRADLVVLCHKPAQLEAVAAQIRDEVKAVASVLGGITISLLQTAYPGTPVFRLMPNTPVEVQRGVICYAPGRGVDPELEDRVIELFERLGTVERIPESLFETATAVSGVGPAYLALLAEAQIDAAVRHGLPHALADRIVTETIEGTAALLAARGYDTRAVRREVTSPGGATARGLAELERARVRGAFHDAIDAAVGRSRD